MKKLWYLELKTIQNLIASPHCRVHIAYDIGKVYIRAKWPIRPELIPDSDA